MSRNLLRARWSRLQINEINEALYRGSLSGVDLPRIALEGVEYIDLRGIELTRQLRDCRFEHLDLSFCTIGDGGGQFLNVMLENCRFVQADCDCIPMNISANRCVFDRAKLHQFGGRLIQCTFRRARMGEHLRPNSMYIRCDFTEVDWRMSHALRHVFDRCVWNGGRFGGGSFAQSQFIGTRPDPAAMEDTIMDDITYC